MTARTIIRFGRVYTEYDPDGLGGGTSTWILSSPGGGSGEGTSEASGTLVPATPGTELKAGMAVYMPEAGHLDLALAVDAGGGAEVDPFRVIGLATMDATTGQSVSVVTDSQLRLIDWTAVTGTEYLVAGRTYYLSKTDPGQLQLTAPEGAGVTVVSVGRAVDQRTFEVEVNTLVRL